MVLMLALLAVAGNALADDSPKTAIDLQFQIIQYEPEVTRDVPLLKDIPVLGHLFRSRETMELSARNVEASVSGAGEGEVPPAVTLVADEVLLKAADQAMRFSGTDDAGTDEVPANWNVLTAPRVMVYPGQSGSISVGHQVPYMEMADDGCLRVVENSAASEGISVEVTADVGPDQTVLIRSLRVKISQVLDRTPIPGVPFDVGAPVINTRETQTSFRIAADKVALLRMPRVSEDNPEVMLAVKAKAVELP